MNETIGRSVRLFLVDGNPSGIITGEIMNWTGHVLAGARSGIANFLARPELDRTGIYFLFGRDLEDPDTPIIYIGESDNVRKRLAQHNKDTAKEFWERTCVVTSKDQNITKAHARYLEARLIAIAEDVGRAKLGNTTAPAPIALPEADQSDMEFFIEQIRLILPVLGFEFLRAKPKTLLEDSELKPVMGEKERSKPVFEITSKKRSLKAQAQEIDGEFIVLAGSAAVPTWLQEKSSYSGYGKLHARLLEQGKLKLNNAGDMATFAEDTAFSSPSAASAVIFGRADNGRTSWRVKGKNITYADWQEQEVANVSPSLQDNDEEISGDSIMETG
ncbi:MAG: GIY-YIG nuclease family protein [Nitrospira sp.]|nr:GIY-YIG nuclease family protein [Nitrospira sp.]